MEHAARLGKDFIIKPEDAEFNDCDYDGEEDFGRICHLCDYEHNFDYEMKGNSPSEDCASRLRRATD